MPEVHLMMRHRRGPTVRHGPLRCVHRSDELRQLRQRLHGRRRRRVRRGGGARSRVVLRVGVGG